MKRRNTLITVILLLAITLSLPGTVEAQGAALDVALGWREYPIVLGNPNAMTVTVTNNGAALLQLFFVGLSFDWMKENVYIYSEESRTPKNITQYAAVQFDIGFNFGDDVSPGSHEARVLVDYAILINNTWNRNPTVYVLPNVEIMAKSGGGFPLSTTTITIIIIIGAILVLERRRIQAFIGKRTKREAKPSKPPEELE